MQTVARGEFQPSARSIALIRTLISPRSYAARVSASRAGGVRPETASAFSPAARNSCARLYAWATPAAYTIPGVEPKRSRYRLAAAWFSASWSRAAARARSSKSPPTIGTELIAAAGGTRRQRRGAVRPRRARGRGGGGGGRAEAAEGCDQAAARGGGERKVVDRRREHIRDLLRDERLGRGHADVERLGEAADRRARLLAER